MPDADRPGGPDPLARQLLLHTAWLDAVRADPHLPVAHLRAGWPAIEAEALFRRLAAAWEAPARAAAATVLDSDGFAAEVDHDLAEARELGITGVPFFVLDRRYGVSGAQPLDVLTTALERAWSDSAA
jgi:protein-disulfide isomerase